MQNKSSLSLVEQFNICCPTPGKCAQSIIPTRCLECGWVAPQDNILEGEWDECWQDENGRWFDEDGVEINTDREPWE